MGIADSSSGTNRRVLPPPDGDSRGFVLELLANLVFTAILRSTAEHPQWKVEVYRLRGPFPGHLHSEVLPPGVEPEARMLELLERNAPSTTA